MKAGEPAAVEVRVLRLSGSEDLPLPERATADASGFDLRASIVDPLSLRPGARALIPTGLSLAIPPGYEGQVRPRSGLALRHGLTLLNSPGTIDADYRGEVAVILINHGEEPVTIRRGERIAQLVVQRLPEVRLVVSEDLPESVRGAGGFGHSGSE